MLTYFIALAGGAAAAAIIFYAKQFKVTLFVQQYGETIKKAYDIIDPIAGQLIKDYSGSEVHQAVQLAVATVADSNLDEADIVEITNYVIAKFSPELAASKVLDLESETGKAALALLDKVKALQDGVSFQELFEVAKAAHALI